MDPDRPLTQGEAELARTIFGGAIDYAQARVANRKWIFFQPRRTIMAPMGTIHYHPAGGTYSEDFAHANPGAQSDFLHEMTHIWQWQQGIFLPLKRHPFCRYDYAMKPGQPFERYGLEQQAEIVRHTFLLRRGLPVAGAPPLAVYEALLPFGVRGV
ncbi:vgr related protein [Sphingomonas sp.]|uniref:vgr related protein n=1 Tax=Sphingomonas sp. TaxID=28214 RepID=UPI001B14D416|nr:vgr related protein [Sphingomonas sp.]MBO9715133.1 vgr related protein [Sphingomonas sp.]